MLTPLHLHKHGEVQLYQKNRKIPRRNPPKGFARLTKNVEVVGRAQIAHFSMTTQPPTPGEVGHKAKGVEEGGQVKAREKEEVHPRGAEDPHQVGKVEVLTGVVPHPVILVPEPHKPPACP